MSQNWLWTKITVVWNDIFYLYLNSKLKNGCKMVILATKMTIFVQFGSKMICLIYSNTETLQLLPPTGSRDPVSLIARYCHTLHKGHIFMLLLRNMGKYWKKPQGCFLTTAINRITTWITCLSPRFPYKGFPIIKKGEFTNNKFQLDV